MFNFGKSFIKAFLLGKTQQKAFRKKINKSKIQKILRAAWAKKLNKVSGKWKPKQGVKIPSISFGPKELVLGSKIFSMKFEKFFGV